MNMQSSTETEIGAVDDFMAAILWIRYWLDAQGYDIFENIVYKDNKGAIILEKNGKASSSKYKSHMNIIYYFVTYSIEKMNSPYNDVPHQT